MKTLVLATIAIICLTVVSGKGSAQGQTQTEATTDEPILEPFTPPSSDSEDTDVAPPAPPPSGCMLPAPAKCDEEENKVAGYFYSPESKECVPIDDACQESVFKNKRACKCECEETNPDECLNYFAKKKEKAEKRARIAECQTAKKKARQAYQAAKIEAKNVCGS